MDRIEIAEQASWRMSRIEMRYMDHHVHEDIQHFYRLCHLIALGNLDRYFEHYGAWLSLDEDFCAAGKEEMGWGTLTQFEIDTINLLNQRVEELERRPYVRQPIVLGPERLRSLA